MFDKKPSDISMLNSVTTAVPAATTTTTTSQPQRPGAIRFKMSMGIAGHVATTGLGVAIADAYQDKRFNKDIDLKTGMCIMFVCLFCVLVCQRVSVFMRLVVTACVQIH